MGLIFRYIFKAGHMHGKACKRAKCMPGKPGSCMKRESVRTWGKQVVKVSEIHPCKRPAIEEFDGEL